MEALRFSHASLRLACEPASTCAPRSRAAFCANALGNYKDRSKSLTLSLSSAKQRAPWRPPKGMRTARWPAQSDSCIRTYIFGNALDASDNRAGSVDRTSTSGDTRTSTRDSAPVDRSEGAPASSAQLMDEKTENVKRHLAAVPLKRKGNASPSSYLEDIRGMGVGIENIVRALQLMARQLYKDLAARQSLGQAPWFAPPLLGFDHTAWLQPLGFQGAVLALLKAGIYLLERGDLEDTVRIRLLHSLVKQAGPLEESLRGALSAKDPTAEVWFFEQIYPPYVAHMLGLLEEDKSFNLAPLFMQLPQQGSDRLLVALALRISVSAKRLSADSLIASTRFSQTLTQEIRALLQQLADIISFQDVHACAVTLGLRAEFLAEFAAKTAGNLDAADAASADARGLWLEALQEQLRAAIRQENVFSDWNSLPGEEALEQDLAIFGFFAVLGRTTRNFLALNGVPFDSSLSPLLRYLEGGSVLFYPELAHLPKYQLFVEVMSEQLAWLPFYAGAAVGPPVAAEHGKEVVKLSRKQQQAALATAQQTCQHWLSEFAMHGEWIKSQPRPASAEFLHRSQQCLALALRATSSGTTAEAPPSFATRPAGEKVMAGVGSVLERLLTGGGSGGESSGSGSLGEGPPARRKPPGGGVYVEGARLESELESLQQIENDLEGFDKELSAVGEVVEKLQRLVRASESSGSSSERVTAARRDLATLRRLQREVAAMEATLKAKTAEREESLRRKQEDVAERTRRQYQEQQQPRGQEDGASAEPQKQRTTDRILSAIGSSAAGVGGVFQRLSISGRQARSGVGGSPLEGESFLKVQQVEEAAEPRHGGAVAGAAIAAAKGRTGSGQKGPIDSVDGSFRDQAAAAMNEASAAMVKEEQIRVDALRRELDLLLEQARAAKNTATTRDGAANEGETGGGASAVDGYQYAADIGGGLRDDYDDGSQLEVGKGSFFSESIGKMRDTTADVWRGTTLLSTDVRVAMRLLKRSAAGEALTQREHKLLRRTLTDVASVLPIAFLMLLPVTAVGHAAILAAIQKYVPGLIPSAWGANRLDVVRRLEQVRGLKEEPSTPDEVIAVESAREPASQAKCDLQSPDEVQL